MNTSNITYPIDLFFLMSFKNTYAKVLQNLKEHPQGENEIQDAKDMSRIAKKVFS